MNLLHSIDALERVLQLNDNIASLSLARFALLPPGDQRATLDDASKNAVLRARELRTSLKLPFWDAAMLMTVNGSGKTPGLFAAAAFHNKPLRPLISIARSDLSSAPLSDVPQDEILAVLSKVQMQDGTSRHIPMLDFHAPTSDVSEAIVCELLQFLGCRGYVLASGKSYHFIGVDLLNEDQFAGFLGSALLFSPIIDRTWLAHQLLEGMCALRISGRPGYGGPPELRASLGVPG
ncbi:MAG TPA: hypothetical protein VJ323_20575 [Bryobacteraceae bacterium]|jgi:hypothetical protein|nr:hypothetical protein [Bryobacteraceae bacterium]